jgi:hypothetical protein
MGIHEYMRDHADDPLMMRAWLLARGKGSKEDKHDHIRDLIRTLDPAADADKEKREKESLDEKLTI